MVPNTFPISLREATQKFSNFGGQTFGTCNCKQYKTNKFKYRAAEK